MLGARKDPHVPGAIRRRRLLEERMRYHDPVDVGILALERVGLVGGSEVHGQLTGVEQVGNLLARRDLVLVECVGVPVSRLDRRRAVQKAGHRGPVGAQVAAPVGDDQGKRHVRLVVLLDGEAPGIRDLVPALVHLDLLGQLDYLFPGQPLLWIAAGNLQPRRLEQVGIHEQPHAGGAHGGRDHLALVSGDLPLGLDEVVRILFGVVLVQWQQRPLVAIRGHQRTVHVEDIDPAPRGKSDCHLLEVLIERNLREDHLDAWVGFLEVRDGRQNGLPAWFTAGHGKVVDLSGGECGRGTKHGNRWDGYEPCE